MILLLLCSTQVATFKEWIGMMDHLLSMQKNYNVSTCTIIVFEFAKTILIGTYDTVTKIHFDIVVTVDDRNSDGILKIRTRVLVAIWYLMMPYLFSGQPYSFFCGIIELTGLAHY